MTYSWNEDQAASCSKMVVLVSRRLHLKNSGAIQHAVGMICFDPNTFQPLTLLERLLDTRFVGGSHGVSTIRTDCWVFNVMQ